MTRPGQDSNVEAEEGFSACLDTVPLDHALVLAAQPVVERDSDRPTCRHAERAWHGDAEA
jgi:hypothetical protein